MLLLQLFLGCRLSVVETGTAFIISWVEVMSTMLQGYGMEGPITRECSTCRFMGSYISMVICPLICHMGYNYSYLTYNPTYNYP